MKLIREILYEKFTQDSDPIEDMGIGMMHQIKRWIKTETTYTPIDKDLLWICAQYGKVDFVKYLLEKGYDVHTENDRALRSASYNGHAEIVKLLIDAGADVHTVNDAALRFASYNGHTEIVKLLIDAGANVHANDDYALRWASENGHTEVVKLLIDAGADVHASNDYALLYASENGHAEIVKLLKDHIAKEKKSNKIVKESINEKFTLDSDPIEDMDIGMMHAINQWALKMGYKMYVDHIDELLNMCAKHGKYKYVEYLLSKGADIHYIYDEPLRNASIFGHLDIVKLLVNNGANVHACNGSALRNASNYNYENIVKYLLETDEFKLSELTNIYNSVLADKQNAEEIKKMFKYYISKKDNK